MQCTQFRFSRKLLLFYFKCFFNRGHYLFIISGRFLLLFLFQVLLQQRTFIYYFRTLATISISSAFSTEDIYLLFQDAIYNYFEDEVFVKIDEQLLRIKFFCNKYCNPERRYEVLRRNILLKYLIKLSSIKYKIYHSIILFYLYISSIYISICLSSVYLSIYLSIYQRYIYLAISAQRVE